MPLTRLQVTAEGFGGAPDVQQTSFSLDVMGRFVCNTFAEATTNLDFDFDVVVIGAGMYGGYTAAKLYSESDVPGRAPLRVLVLEAGPFLVHEHGQNIPDLGLSNPFRPSSGRRSAGALLPRLGQRVDRQRGLSGYCLLRGRQVALLRRLVPAPARSGSGAVAPAGERLPHRPAHLRQQPAQPGGTRCACLDLRSSRIRDRRAARRRQRVRPCGQSKRTAGSAELERRAQGASVGCAGHAAARPVDPPIAVQTQSFVSSVFSPDKYSSLTCPRNGAVPARDSYLYNRL